LLPARAKSIQDTPTPSPNGVAAIVAFRLHELTGGTRWRDRGVALIQAFAGRAEELGLHAATYLLAVDWALNPATHLVVVGDLHEETALAMHRVALAAFMPRRLVQLVSTDRLSDQALPQAVTGMLAAGQAPRGYACTGTSCSAPVSDLASWRAALESVRSVVA
jgi:uncharacterized protein YyaL (SSP411 family)